LGTNRPAQTPARANNGLPSLARLELTAWRKKSIATAQVEDLTRVAVIPPSGAPWSLTLTRGEVNSRAQRPGSFASS
jgi:hypothetical protein